MQARHVLARLAPVVPEYVPALQGVQVKDPRSDAYVPAEHVGHTDTPAVLDAVPGWHGWHTEAPLRE